MVISVYQLVKDNKDLPEGDFFEALSGATSELFMPVLDNYAGSAKNIVQYIAAAYSIDSNEIIIKSNFSVRKPQLAERYDISDLIYNDVVELNSGIIRSVVLQYLEYQGDLEFKNLRMLEHMYEKMMNSAFTDDFDISNVLANRETLSELLRDINELKRELMEKYIVYYDNKDQLKEKTKPLSLNNILSSPHIKKHQVHKS